MATRNILFIGKGGVGKTSIACATAMSVSGIEKRVLLVGADPACNLAEVLAIPEVGIQPVPVQTVPGLFAMRIDADEAVKLYRDRLAATNRELSPEDALKSVEQQLPGYSVVEIAVCEEFARLVADPEYTKDYDLIVFDMAATGHALRLLQLPSALLQFIETKAGGSSCLGPLSGSQAKLYQDTIAALSASTMVILVSHPEDASLAEAERAHHELRALGLRDQRLMVNEVFWCREAFDPAARALEGRGSRATAELPVGIRSLLKTDVLYMARTLIGPNALKFIGKRVYSPESREKPTDLDKLPRPLSELIPLLSARRKGVIIVMGKGGAGKTTIAAAVAVELARMGLPVNLTTTDPAEHLSMIMGSGTEGVTVSQIDPIAETRAYTEEALRELGQGLDEKERMRLEEDLRSPFTEQIAVLRALALMVNQGNDGFVVIDTAPTGHSLQLLASACTYNRDVERSLRYIPESVRQLIPQLQDPEFAKVLIATLPEATSVHEGERLQQDLVEAGIEPYAWVINKCFRPCDTDDPVLIQRGILEGPYIEEVQKLSNRVFLIPWQRKAPVGTELLQEMLEPAPTK
ncbi:MAG: arsenical pump-driving ATPase [Acidobacteria bacterium]|nr:MAG: arsenical pump-driving ATPase [Acidobacteriota bacterium]